MRVSDLNIDKDKMERGREPEREQQHTESDHSERKKGPEKQSSDDTMVVPTPSPEATAQEGQEEYVDENSASGGPKAPHPLRRPTLLKGEAADSRFTVAEVDDRIVEPQKLQLELDGEPMEIQSQIQMYATNL